MSELYKLPGWNTPVTSEMIEDATCALSRSEAYAIKREIDKLKNIPPIQITVNTFHPLDISEVMRGEGIGL